MSAGWKPPASSVFFPIIRLRSDQIADGNRLLLRVAGPRPLTGMSSAVTRCWVASLPDPRGPRLPSSKLIFGRYTSQTVQLDHRAIADPAGLKAALEPCAGASVAWSASSARP